MASIVARRDLDDSREDAARSVDEKGCTRAGPV